MDDLIALIESIQEGLANPDNNFSNEDLLNIESVLSQANNLLGSSARPVTPPSGSEILWVLAGGNPQAFASYMRSFPNQELNEFSQNPSALNSLIAQFSNTITMPQGEAEDGIAKSGIQSSNVYGFQYDPRTQTLRVRFNNGGVYEYDGVPANVFKMFANGAIPAKTDGENQWGAWWVGKMPSIGASFYQLIRDSFPYEKVA